MVGFAFGNDGKHINKQYKAFRQRAKRIAWSIDEFGDIEISKFDLETVNFDQSENPRYFMIDTRPVEGEVSKYYDLRELDNR